MVIFGANRLFGCWTLHFCFKLLTNGFGPDENNSQTNISFRLQLKTVQELSGVIATHPGFLISLKIDAFFYDITSSLN